jgi:hypothetical protein
MVRNLTTLILSGVLGSIVMAGNAEACHKKKCACATPAPAPCTVTYVTPAPCVTPVVTTSCVPKVKHCFTLPKLFHHKKVATCATPVPCGTPVSYYAAAAPVSYPVSLPLGSAQH